MSAVIAAFMAAVLTFFATVILTKQRHSREDLRSLAPLFGALRDLNTTCMFGPGMSDEYAEELVQLAASSYEPHRDILLVLAHCSPSVNVRQAAHESALAFSRAAAACAQAVRDAHSGYRKGFNGEPSDAIEKAEQSLMALVQVLQDDVSFKNKITAVVKRAPRLRRKTQDDPSLGDHRSKLTVLFTFAGLAGFIAFAFALGNSGEEVALSLVQNFFAFLALWGLSLLLTAWYDHMEWRRPDRNLVAVFEKSLKPEETAEPDTE